MRVLLDTCVLIEIRKPDGDKAVKKAVDDLPDENLFISVISIGEIVNGIALLESGLRKTALQEWMQGLETGWRESILAIDIETVQVWGNLTASAQRNGKTLSVADGLIAATAIRHGLYLMTCNVTDIERTGAMLINPWA